MRSRRFETAMRMASPVVRSVLLASLVFCGGAIAEELAQEPDCTDFSDNSRLDARERQWCQARALKEKYLQGGRFTEKPPAGQTGQARNVHGKLSSQFSSSGSSRVGGSVTIGELQGRFRLRLASTSNTLYHGRKIRISGTATSGEGRLEIYSPVDIDLWKLAMVLVDDPVRREPPPEEGLHLKGYLVTEIAPGPGKRFSAELLALAGKYMLLLNAPDGVARDIRIDIADP